MTKREKELFYEDRIMPCGCGNKFYEGPCGGMSTNIECPVCGLKLNVVLEAYVPMGQVIFEPVGYKVASRKLKPTYFQYWLEKLGIRAKVY